MIKTVKFKKSFRLDELIKYVWDNAIYPSHFECHAGFKIHFDSRAGIKVDNDYVHSYVSTFTVEVEEEITEDTEFGAYVVVHQNGSVSQSNTHGSIRKIMKTAESVEPKELHAVINGKLELIWEAE